jgi:hypothetical protein
MSDASSGIVGADDTAHWFASHAASMGVKFDQPIPQHIHVLQAPPLYPDAAGAPRPVTAEGVPLLFQWLTAFHKGAVPHDPTPSMEHAEKSAGSGRYLFWKRRARVYAVSMAAILRRLSRTGAIAPVYTPPAHRGLGNRPNNAARVPNWHASARRRFDRTAKKLRSYCGHLRQIHLVTHGGRQ